MALTESATIASWDDGYGYGSLVSGTISLPSDSLIVILQTNLTDATSNFYPTAPSNSGTALTWTKVGSDLHPSGSAVYANAWYAKNTSSQSVTITLGRPANTAGSYAGQSGIGLIYTGHDATTPFSSTYYDTSTTNNLTTAGISASGAGALIAAWVDSSSASPHTSSDGTVLEQTATGNSGLVRKAISGSGSNTINIDAAGTAATGYAYTQFYAQAAAGAATIEATASLSATSSLTTAAVAVKFATVSLSASSSLTTAAGSEKLADPTLAATATLAVEAMGNVAASATLSAAAALTTAGTVTASDFSSEIVGSTGSYTYGHVEVPAALIDGVGTLIASDANCGNSQTYGLAVRFPYPDDRDAEHSITVNYQIRNTARRVFVDIMKPFGRGTEEADTPYLNEYSADVYAPFRMDGFAVEPANSIGADAAITYRWDVARQAWYIDSWSGSTLLTDNRPNEMPDGMTPMFFSPAVRAHARWSEIRDRMVASLMSLPYWYHRFNWSSHFCADVTEQGAGMLASIGARHVLNGAEFSATSGRTIVPVSIAQWTMQGTDTPFEAGPIICDGDTLLHEVGHLWDFMGLSYGGHPYGIEPATYPGVPAIPAPPWPVDVYEYYDAPANTQMSGELHVYEGGNFYWIAYDEAGGFAAYYEGWVPRFPTVSGEQPVIDLYAEVPPDSPVVTPNYYKSSIVEWVGQSFGYYLQSRTVSFVEQDSKSVYEFSTPELQAAFEAYLVDAGVIPFIDAMVATATLTADAFVTRPASADLTATSTLTTAAIVDIPAAATLSATSDLAVEGTVVVPAAADLAASATLAVDAVVIPVVWADAPLAAAATLTADAYVVRPASVTLTAAATLASPSSTSIVVSLPAAATLTAVAYSTRFSTISMASAATLSATAGVTLAGTVPPLAASTTLAAAAIVIRFGNLEPDVGVGRGRLTSPAAPGHRLTSPAAWSSRPTTPPGASHRLTGG